MMTATRPTPTRYDSSRVVAIHEAGHAVAHMLLGHHVRSANMHAGTMNDYATHGKVTYASLGTAGLADIVGAAAGEAAVLHLMWQEQHLYSGVLASASPSAIAASTGEHDREYIAGIAADATLPVGVGAAIAARVLTVHWDAVERVADALDRSLDGRLDDAAISVAASLDGVEIGWVELCALATESAPANADLQAYLTGPGQHAEDHLVEYVRHLRAHNILYTPAPALRRHINREILDRGMPEIEAALHAAIGGEQR